MDTVIVMRPLSQKVRVVKRRKKSAGDFQEQRRGQHFMMDGFNLWFTIPILYLKGAEMMLFTFQSQGMIFKGQKNYMLPY